MSVDNKLCGARIQAIRKERKMTAGELAERVGIGEVSLLHIECGSRGPSLQTLYSKNANVPVQQGRAAMCVASTSALPYIESDTMEGITIDAAPLPAHKNNCQLYYGTNVAVFNTGSDAQKEACWLYLKYMTSTENTAYFAAQTGYIPVRKSAQTDPVFAAVLAEKPIKQMCFDYMDVGFQGARSVGIINALDALGDQLDLVFSGEKDLDSALKDAQTNGEKAMAEARSN